MTYHIENIKKARKNHFFNDAGCEIWTLDNWFHRKDEPAVIHLDGTKEYFYYGVYHREDGPAVERPKGNHVWFYNGIKITPQELIKKHPEHMVTIISYLI